MKDGFRSISEELFVVSPSNLVHRSTSARQRQSSNRVTLTSFSRSHRSLRRWHIKGGFCSISEEIFDISSPNMVHRSTNARQRLSLNWVTLTSFSGSQRSFKSMTCGKMVAAQYPKKYLIYPHQICYTEAPVQDEYKV